MSKIRLTAETVEALPVDGKDSLYFDTIVNGFGLRVTPSGKKIFIAQRRFGGKPLRVSVGYYPLWTVAKARDAARAKLNAMAHGIDPRDTIATPPSTGELSFADAVDKWLSEHVRLKLKELTVRDYEKLAAKLKDRFAGRSLDSITKDDARRLHASMANTPRRANYTLTILSTILSYSDRPNITARIKRYREKLKERILSEVELERVFTAITKLESDKKLSVFAAQAIRFAILTGARPKEITSIEWEFLKYQFKHVALPDSKTNRPRIIYCNSSAWTVLVSTPHFGKFVFAGRERNTAYSRLTNAWNAVRKVANLSDVRLYDCRHSFASQAAMAGHNLPMIGKLLGHTVAATTQRYVHLGGDPAAEAAQDVGNRLSAAMNKSADKAGVTSIKRSNKARNSREAS